VIDVQRVVLDPGPRVRDRDVGQPAALGVAPFVVIALLEVAAGECLGERGGQTADDPLLIHG
jgi:hypothetical protein